MAKTDNIEVDGVVVDALPGMMFKVDIGHGHIVLAQLAGKLRLNNIRITVGDKVLLEVSPYDLTKGRIIWRKS